TCWHLFFLPRIYESRPLGLPPWISPPRRSLSSPRQHLLYHKHNLRWGAHNEVLEQDLRAAFFRAHAQADVTALELVVLNRVEHAPIGVKTQTTANAVAANGIALARIGGRFTHVDWRGERFVEREPRILPGTHFGDAVEAVGP